MGDQFLSTTTTGLQTPIKGMEPHSPSLYLSVCLLVHNCVGRHESKTSCITAVDPDRHYKVVCRPPKFLRSRLEGQRPETTCCGAYLGVPYDSQKKSLPIPVSIEEKGFCESRPVFPPVGLSERTHPTMTAS